MASHLSSAYAFLTLGFRTKDAVQNSIMTNWNGLTEADKICISVIHLSMILIKALKTLVNCILDFRELRKFCHIAPCLLQKLENRNCSEHTWLLRARKCLLCTRRFLKTIINNEHIRRIESSPVGPRALAQASPNHVYGDRNRSSVFL